MEDPTCPRGALASRGLSFVNCSEDAEARSHLNSTMVVYGGAIGDGNAHDHRNLPVLIAGGAAGEALASGHGTYRRVAGDVPLCDLLVSVAARMGVAMARFGDSRGNAEGGVAHVRWSRPSY